MLTLIGSTAAKHWFPDFRTPVDVDYHSPNPMPLNQDAGRLDVFVDERLGQWDWSSTGVATPEELYTLKVSHAFWEIGDSWNKHMNDVLFYQGKEVKFNRELYDIVFPIWKELHGRKITSLKANSKDFFKDAVPRVYDHDSIHASIAYYDKPLYESILVPGEEVMVDSSKFFEGMDWDTQIKLVREEVYTTALERILIPKDYKHSPSSAYAWALRRTITSLFKGEWALWAVLNYSTLVRADVDYRQRHLDNKAKLIRLETE